MDAVTEVLEKEPKKSTEKTAKATKGKAAGKEKSGGAALPVRRVFCGRGSGPGTADGIAGLGRSRDRLGVDREDPGSTRHQ